ncbi:MAG: xanthine dehydrogenase family protein subunit M [Chloroflexi bacterium]|nr:xanthine dehydrogenase family protein subunit M [Chloroflexota bacterium]
MVYHEPRSAAEVCSLLAGYGEEGRIIAGGQSLMVLLKQRLIAPAHLINLKSATDLDYLQYDKGEGLKLGAISPHRTLEASSVIREKFPVLTEMASKLGSIQIRNWGTVGGSLCHADPSGDPAPVLMVLGAKVKLASAGETRVVALEDFFADYLETILQPDEMLVEIQIPTPPPRSGSAYLKESVRAGDMAIVGVAATVTLEPGNGKCKQARIVLGGAGSTPIRAREAEKLIAGQPLEAPLLAEAADQAAKEAHPTADIYFSPEYKRELIRVTARRALALAGQRAGQS